MRREEMKLEQLVKQFMADPTLKGLLSRASCRNEQTRRDQYEEMFWGFR